MRTAAHRAGVWLSLLSAVVVLGGCVPDTVPSPSPIPSSPPSTPLFASDDEALAAATDAYKAYLAMSDLILSEGGANPERIESVSAEPARTQIISDIQEYVDGGLHITGMTKIGAAKLQSQTEDLGIAKLRIYVCDDVSAVDVLDRSGVSIVSPSRVVETPFVAELSGTVGHLLLDSKDFWTGENFCSEK